MHQHLLDGLGAQVAHSLDIGTQHDHVGHLGIAQLIGDIQAGNVDSTHIIAADLLRDNGAVDEDGTALDHGGLELQQAGQIHSDQLSWVPERWGR